MELEENVNNQQTDINEEKVLFEWIAAERAFMRREKDYWVTALAILILVAVIFIFVKEFFLIIALCSLLFLYYVTSTVPPSKVSYKITSRGFYFGDSHYYWDIFEKFWFKPSLNTEMIHFGTYLRFPRSISLVINPEDKEKIKEIVIKKLPLIENPPSFIDKLSDWAAKRLPLENRPTQEKKV